MSILSRIFKRKAVVSIIKGATEQKESIVKETAGAYATEDFVPPQNEVRSYSDIQSMYDTSSLLKQYINAILNEALRYEFIARTKPGLDESTKTKGRVATLNMLMRKCNETESFNNVREKYIKDLYLYGRAGIELEPSTGSTVQSIYAVPGYCIRLNVDETGSNFKSDTKAYSITSPEEPNKEVASFPSDSLIYLVLDNLSDRVYGSDPITSIYETLQTDINASSKLKAGSYKLKFGVLCLPKAPTKLLRDIISRFNALIKRNTGVGIVASNFDGKFVDVSNMDAETTITLQKWLINKGNVWNIPPFKLGMSGELGSLSAREQRDDFRALIERLVKYELSKLNAVLVATKFGFDDVELYCPDLATKLSYERARIAVRLVGGRIVTPNEARSLYLGLDPLEDPRANQLQIPEEVENPNNDNPPKEVEDVPPTNSK